LIFPTMTKSTKFGKKMQGILRVKKVVIVDSEKQMCMWVPMAKTLHWEYDSEIPIIMSKNTFKYFQTHWNTSKFTINTFKNTINIV
jgi:hypothetical protein